MAKVNLYPDFREFLKLLNSAKVKYLVLGGYAVNHYGHHRSTADLDVWIAQEPGTLAATSQLLQEFAGFPAAKVKPSILGKPNALIMFGREPVRIDLLTAPAGISFDACYARRQTAKWDGITVPLLSLPDLISNKRASGRAKDMADVESLTAISVPKNTKRRKRSGS